MKKTNDINKQNYISPEIEVIAFGSHGIIDTTGASPYNEVEVDALCLNYTPLDFPEGSVTERDPIN